MKPNETAPTRARHISRTIVPERHDIECYSCGYVFVLTGKLHNNFCPKCRELLKVDHMVIENECSDEVSTIGTIEIREQAKLSGARLVGGNVILAGDARQGSICAFRSLELCPGATLDESKLILRDLVVRPGVKITLRRKLQCRNIEVRGSISANFLADGIVTVFSGGCLRGRITAHRLVVEDGGGLKASVTIEKQEDNERNHDATEARPGKRAERPDKRRQNRAVGKKG